MKRDKSEPWDEPEEQAEVERAETRPGRRARGPAESRLRGLWLRLLLRGVVWVAVASAIVFALDRADHYLASNPRFDLAADPDRPDRSPALEIRGVVHASLPEVRQVFAPDIGRSVYLAPLTPRRSQLLALPWVKDATVARIWPAGLRVTVVERTPAAFVPLQDGPRQSSSMMLIDADGVLLDPPPHRFSLPVLLGIQPREELASRRRKVQRMLRLEAAIGGEMRALSEIDASDPLNLVVTRRMDDRLVTIKLGDGNYAARLRNFLSHYGELHARLPRSRAFDLRVDGRITALPEDSNAQ